MDFSFNLEGQALTGSINPEAMMGMTTILGAFLGGFAILWVTIYVAIMVLMIISRWKLLTKAKLPGRGILIPVYNRVLKFKLGGLSGRWSLGFVLGIIAGIVNTLTLNMTLGTSIISIIGIVGTIISFIAMIVNYFKIAEKFGKHWAFGLGMLFVKIIFIPILAFDNSKYMGTVKKANKTTPVTPTKKAAVKKIVKKTSTKKITKKAPAKKAPTKKPVKKVKTLTKKK